ncbi:HupE/UreJ family protein [Maritimibacter sp. DP1N21-5]|uniref:HupE/UreJ family protein n=1 Tax=Maritimibacter sp. DP1N21-5 TaxID=2836867 RepID=UPI001C451165|nr:HupE/UreJ family protein [Maritimibacter sp. DP1N21-5]MBV7410838.1 HupE/UreJ family protein [Maritimibacter sp. DP1N21-5]
MDPRKSTAVPPTCAKVTAAWVLVLAVVACLCAAQARAHEVQPAIADVTVSEGRVDVTVILNGEAIAAGIDLSSITDTNDAPNAADYDVLRALPPADFAARFRDGWDEFAAGLGLRAGEVPLDAELLSVETEPGEADSLPRQTRVLWTAALPVGDAPGGGDGVSFAWDERYGPVILRQIVEPEPESEDPYAAFLNPGQRSEEMPRTGTARLGTGAAILNYISIGYTHILPKGLDHILFVLGLFFFSLQMRPLVTQITAFTVAHTLTLALATLGIVRIPASVVEPLIALSIAYIAIENIVRPRLTGVRIAVVFAFGLLHGVGFASVLSDIGLSSGRFVISLISFNVGVELGQLSVVLAAYLGLGIWFGSKAWYRSAIVIPMSSVIGIIGLWWTIERVIL